MKYIKKYSNVNNAVNDNGIISPFLCSIGIEGSEFPAILGMKTEEPYQPLDIEINPETGEPEIFPAASNSVITYKSSSQLVNFNSNIFNASVLSHEYNSATGDGTITFDGTLTEIGRNSGTIADNSDDITDITIPKTISYWRNDTVFSSGGKWYRTLNIHVTQQDDTIITYGNAPVSGGGRTIYFYLNNGTQVYIQYQSCIAKDTPITLADKSTKLIQDITYNDELLVWDFDNSRYSVAKPLWIKKGEMSHNYHLCKFSNNTELKLIGPKTHRVFNYTDQRFDYAIDCIGKEIYTENGIAILLSCELVNESIEFYNIITDYHMNLFANHILTSCRYNNMYPIENMKFIKEERPIISLDNYNVPEKYYYGMRLGEQVIPVDESQKYIQNLINLSL